MVTKASWVYGLAQIFPTFRCSALPAKTKNCGAFFRWIDPPFSSSMSMNKTSPIPKVWPFWDRYPSLIIIPLISQHKLIPKNKSHIVVYCWLFPISPNNLYKWLVSCHHTHDIPCIAQIPMISQDEAGAPGPPAQMTTPRPLTLIGVAWPENFMFSTCRSMKVASIHMELLIDEFSNLNLRRILVEKGKIRYGH